MTSKQTLGFLAITRRAKGHMSWLLFCFCGDEDWVMEFGENYLGVIGIISFPLLMGGCYRNHTEKT